MSRFLHDLAIAHRNHEGWYPPGRTPFPSGSLSWRNNNPGNLRLTAYQRRVYGAEQGQGGFARFPSYEVGLQALMDDLRAKITGNSAHINYRTNPTFLTYIRVYAPKDDGNNPNGYTQALIRSLPQYNLRPDTPLSEMARLIEAGEQTQMMFSASAQLKRFSRAIERLLKRGLNQAAESLARTKARFRDRL